MDQRRLITFMLTASLIMLGYLQLQLFLNPPQPPEEVAENVEQVDGEAVEVKLPDEAQDDAEPTGEAVSGEVADNADFADGEQDEETAESDIPLQRHVLGSLDPNSPYQIAVTFSNQGAAIERIELNNPNYQELDDPSGYLGYLSLTDAETGGCRVSTVAPGTPAALAKCLEGGDQPGIRGTTFVEEAGGTFPSLPGDRIIQLDEQDIGDAAAFLEAMKATRPKQSINLTVMRPAAGGGESRLRFQALLTKTPLSVVSPEHGFDNDQAKPDQLSFLCTYGKISDAKVGLAKDEINGLPSLWHENWRVELLQGGTGIEFRRRLTTSEVASVGGKSGLEMVKRYMLTKVDRDAEKLGSGGYGIQLELEIKNVGNRPQELAYQIDGPSGLPLEGWWYSYKTHPTSFKVAGARDVVFREEGGSHKLFVCSEITKKAMDEEKSPFTPLAESTNNMEVQYAGCDAQYFSVALLPLTDSKLGTQIFSEAVARAVGPLDEEKRKKRTNTSFRLTSRSLELAPGESVQDQFLIFAGPKDANVLEYYGLQDCIVYGWFGFVAKPMLAILHFFRAFIPSWGLSIICLTVLVRGCMYPLGRRMALNAQKMQELAPEMKVIAEKYKNDLEKRSQAQRELFSKHNYNPLAGCPVMFLQLPIFVGLYRSLSVDIALRQAPFLPGMSWCSNLAGPDKFWNWQSFVPEFISSPNGYLGPYLNILPLIAAGLMLLQQKMFTPPPQDEQQEMQQNIMKFMMLFMAFIFHKVAAGLCVYLIASSLWGVAERKLLPKPKLADQNKAPENKGKSATSAKSAIEGGLAKLGLGSNGANGTTAEEKRKKRKKRKR